MDSPYDDSFHDRIHLVRDMLQNYALPATASNDSSSATLSVVVACHSHAPLQEFWDRVSAPKLCITMPCCAQYSELIGIDPTLEYDNFEVYSPKRRTKILFCG